MRQLAVLSAALTQAVSFWYLLDRNVLRDVKRPKRPPRDRLIEDQLTQAVARSGAGDLEKVLRGGETWTVE